MLSHQTNTRFLGIFYGLLLASSLWLVSCEQDPTLEEQKKQLSTYRTEMMQLKEKISELESQIANADGEKKEKTYKRVVVEPLRTETFQHFVEVQGKVTSDKNVTITSEMSGVVLRKFVEEGQEVRQGQPLVQLDMETIERNVDEVEKRLELAKVIFQKQENLYKQQIGSEIQFLQAKNNMESLEKQRQTLLSQLAKATIKSPINGVVDKFFINQGEMAMAGIPVGRVVNLSRVEVVAELSERYVPFVSKGDSVVLRFEMLGIEKKVPIRRVGRFINPENRTFTLETVIDNIDGMLRPNSVATMRINDFTQEDAISIPSFILQKSTQGGQFVYIAHRGEGYPTVKKVFIETGKSYQGRTMVTKGLSTGDQVLVKGYSDVVENERVELVEDTLGTAAR